MRNMLWCIAVVAVALTSCTSPANSNQERTGNDNQSRMYGVGMIGQQSSGEPAVGGTVTFAAYSEPDVLDPARTIVAGTTGGIALCAVYGALLRWNPKTHNVEPKLAKSLTADDNYKTWTLTLRNDVMFSDGTPLDAEAVTWSVRRYLAVGGELASVWQDNVTAMRVSDQHTVVFTST